MTDPQEIKARWTEYCSDSYSHKAGGDSNAWNVRVIDNIENQAEDTILKSEVEEVIKALKKGKSPGVDNIPAELIQAGGVS